MKKVDTRTVFEKAIDKLNDPKAWRYGAAEYDYESGSSCGDECEGYCHHTTVNNVEITEVNVDYIVKELTTGCKDVLTSYCIDRVIHSSKLHETSSWAANVGRGYYGQEVNGVSLKDDVKKQLIEQLAELNSLTSDIERIKKVLEYEYGYILPKIKDLTTAKVVSVKIDEIKILNDEYLRKVSKETVDYYQSYELPRGVCMKEGDHYSLVDGYHRMFSALKYKLAKVVIIELS